VSRPGARLSSGRFGSPGRRRSPATTARVLASVATGFLACGFAASAAAHAILVESSPQAAQALDAAPTRLTLRFNSRIASSVSGVVLLGPGRRSIPLAAAVAEGGSAPDRLAFRVPPLGPGTYEVQWRALANDGHVSTGTFYFTIGVRQ
jgi:methionine-rich copper-binding protein CopC